MRFPRMSTAGGPISTLADLGRGRVLALGVVQSRGVITHVAYLYDALADRWNTAARPPLDGPALTLRLPSGKILGGDNDSYSLGPFDLRAGSAGQNAVWPCHKSFCDEFWAVILRVERAMPAHGRVRRRVRPRLSGRKEHSGQSFLV